jgi:hypothetical protein
MRKDLSGNHQSSATLGTWSVLFLLVLIVCVYTCARLHIPSLLDRYDTKTRWAENVGREGATRYRRDPR